MEGNKLEEEEKVSSKQKPQMLQWLEEEEEEEEKEKEKEEGSNFHLARLREVIRRDLWKDPW